MAENGHYKGRKKPTGTRQGMYATAPSGEFLASVNTRSPERVAEMLRTALARWKELPREKRLLPEDPKLQLEKIHRLESRYPEGGLILQVNSRDLPREQLPNDWRKHAWNIDHAWFSRDEARSFLPEGDLEALEKGTTHALPKKLAERIARCHLVDNVRGQTSSYEPDHLEKAEVTITVSAVRKGEVRVTLEGEARAEAKGRWPVKGFRDMNAPEEQVRGFEGKLVGRGRFDIETGRFTQFDLVFIGARWGGTQYNGRGDDLDPAPMGVAFTLSKSDQRVAPATIWKY